MKELLEQYFLIQRQIYDRLGYKGRWEVLPLDDCTDQYWMIVDSGGALIHSPASFTKESIDFGMDVYEEQVTGDVVRTEECTAIEVDTQCDGNRFLMVFNNAKECKDGAIIEYYEGR